MKWFVKCIRNYVNFRGRASRSEYWYFILFSVLFLIAAILLDKLLFGNSRSVFYSVFALFIFLPQIAVMVRRLHDTNRSGKIVLWYYLTGIVWILLMAFLGYSNFIAAARGQSVGSPTGFFLAVILIVTFVFLVWGIFFLVWFCTKGTTGDNKYGPDPLAE